MSRQFFLNFKPVSLRKISEQTMTWKRLIPLFILVFSLLGFTNTVFAQTEENAKTEAKEGGKEEGKLNVSKEIFGHIADAHEWHLFTIKHEGAEPTHISFPLPVIIYHPEKGLSVFSSSNIEEGKTYEGYSIEKGPMKEKVVSADKAKILDFSITKNVLSMIFSVIILLWLMTSAAKKYTKNGHMTAPSGFQNALEAIIIFLRDEVAKPNLGDKYKKFFPLLLTVFFFIWINNLLGLLPGGANFTGNIAVTACLALVAFVVILATSNKHFWGHLFNPPGVPLGIKFLLVPIEIISLFIKPMALMIRLFANIMAGHIVILALICRVFIFGALNKFVGIGFVPVSLAFSIFMFMLELLVGAIQAFIFVNLTAVFIGQSMEGEHSHGEEGPHETHEGAII